MKVGKFGGVSLISRICGRREPRNNNSEQGRTFHPIFAKTGMRNMLATDVRGIHTIRDKFRHRSGHLAGRGMISPRRSLHV